MSKRWIALLVALCALVLAAPAGAQAGGRLNGSELYWLGPYFGGLRLTDTSYQAFVYGECEPPAGEGGCSPPVQVGNATSCTRNPIAVGGLVRDVFLVRGGGLAVAYAPGAVDVGTGRQTLSLRASEPEVLGAALREVRRRSEPGPEPFAPPVYPLPVLRELKRVTVAAERFDGVAAIAAATGLRPDEVKVRSRIAELWDRTPSPASPPRRCRLPRWNGCGSWPSGCRPTTSPTPPNGTRCRSRPCARRSAGCEGSPAVVLRPRRPGAARSRR